MKDGSVKLKFEAGEITGVYINSHLDQIYKKLFENARLNISKNPEKIEHGIKAIIFGCFLLETYSNEYLKYFLDNFIDKKKFGKSLWETLKRANVLDKIKIISSFAKGNQLQKYNSFKNGLKKAFDTRNRLAHFKDKDYQIAEAISIDEVGDIIFSAPEPELIQELKKEKIQRHTSVILEASQWLNNIYKMHSGAEMIKLKK
jgi:hypothetical protein